ncbi:hypothetical protein BPO_p0061 (plasmid) [Bergeyella porcorum]|uniref:Uncharacterized protein n=1 Tax=Bergeyella porcorum TaxID=1735111 RepID=A0AAU0F659_9FLAO
MKKIFSILLLLLGITLGFAQTLITQDNTDGVTGSGSKAQISQYTAKGISITWDANDSKYAFDSQELTKLPKDQYPSVKNADGTAVLVPYKAVVNGKDDLSPPKSPLPNKKY